jgi:hypothetical protein
MIHIGIDDTDMPGTPGTNQLARRVADALPDGFALVVALRHQLLFDHRVPYTSQNGSASLLLRAADGRRASELVPLLRREMQAWYVPGSDPGFCVAEHVPPAIVDFGGRCQRELITEDEARAVARAHDVHLEGVGGTEGGIIGALAAVGLLAGGADGRVVHAAGWPWPDAFAGRRTIAAVRARGVDEVRDVISGRPVVAGVVDVGKHLRPSYRDGRVVLFVEPDAAGGARVAAAAADGPRWRALKLP